MTRRVVFAVAAMAIGVAGCGTRPRPEAREASPAATRSGARQQAADATEEDGAHLIRIAEDMLRDLKLTTAVVESRPGGEGVTVLGELHVDEERYAEVASPVSAEARTLRAAPGDRVRAGQVLAELFALDVGRAQGAYREAAARRDLAEKALARKRALAEERIASGREVQEAEAEFRAAEGAFAAASSGLAGMGASAEGTGGAIPLRSPVSGIVLERSVVRGQVVEAGRTLFKVGDLGSLWLLAHASERDAVRVQEGSSARVSLPAMPGQTLSARVVQVGRQVDAASRTIPVRLTLANPGERLRPGMSATVLLPMGEGASLLSVPAASLQRFDEAWCVFVPKEPGVFEARKVGRGRDLGGEVEILSGLAAGDVVIVDGAFLLKAQGEKAMGEGGHHDH
jgi:cobalt-zinc-cadmium efflux system membrane fusion protein